MKIVPCHSGSWSIPGARTRAPRSRPFGWLGLLAAIAAVLATGSAGPARLQAADAVPPVRPILEELNSGDSLFHFTTNRHSVIWTELNRSRLFKNFGADASFVASMKVLVDTVNARLKKLDATQPGAQSGNTFDQLAKVGPTAVFMSLLKERGTRARLLAAHDAQPDFLRTLTTLMTSNGEEFLGGVATQAEPDYTIPGPGYRVKNNWTILQGDSSVNVFLNDHNYMVLGPATSEADALKRWHAPLTGNLDSFATFLGEGAPWLAGFMADFDSFGKLLDEAVTGFGPENPDLFGPKGLRYMRAKEWVNKDGRFEAYGEAVAVDLHKHLLFSGAAKPINMKLVDATPADAAFALYLNLDVEEIMAAGEAEMAGHSAAYTRLATSMKESFAGMLQHGYNQQPATNKTAEVFDTPTANRGMMFVVFDPDRLEEIDSSIALSIAIRPGFKASEAWARAVLNHPKEEDAVVPAEGQRSEFKMTEYSGVTIYMSKRWRTDCIATTETAFLRADDLKVIKRMIKASQNVKQNAAAENKFVEWDKIKALAAQDEASNLCGFAIVRTPALLSKYAGTALGAIALAFPQVKTDENWAQMVTGLDASIGVLTYSPATGLRAHTVSDLPIPSAAAFVGEFAILTEMRWEGTRMMMGDHAPEEDDLPPVVGAADNDRTPPGMGGGVAPMPPMPAP